MPYACVTGTTLLTDRVCIAAVIDQGGWSVSKAAYDAFLCAHYMVLLVALASVVPRRRLPLLTGAGRNSLFVFIWHMPLLHPAINLDFGSRLAQVYAVN